MTLEIAALIIMACKYPGNYGTGAKDVQKYENACTFKLTYCVRQKELDASLAELAREKDPAKRIGSDNPKTSLLTGLDVLNCAKDRVYKD